MPALRRLIVAVLALGLTVALAAPASAHTAREQVPLHEAIDRLAVADERRDGYDRDKFNHWVDADRDGCNTRQEVLLAEAVEHPQVQGRCRIVDGTGAWASYYDDVTVTGARGLDIDHMVPLAEAWDSGAHGWDAQRRERYANDLGDERALVAVTARSNRQKADQDPAQWLPPHVPARCRYLREWTTIKLRWSLTVDTREKNQLVRLGAACPNDPIIIEPAA
jgi:hypothetical protein